MEPSIFTWERRDYRTKPDLFYWKVTGILAIAAFASWLYVLTPTVHADKNINPNDVKTLEAACQYAGLYPENIQNLSSLEAACVKNGTPIQPL
jgi:hypothetical protein